MINAPPPLGTAAASDTQDTSRRTVVFLGTPSNCSDRMLTVLSHDFIDIQFTRCLDLHDLSALTRRNSQVHTVILEECDVPALLDRPMLFFAAAREARITLAYRNSGVAAAVLAAAERDHTLASVSLLPLDVHMEVWISVVRLLLLDVTYIPADLSRPGMSSQSSTALPAPPIAEASSPETSGLHSQSADIGLTRRELEVLQLAATGLQNKNIAEKLALSEHTVKLHMHHVLSKLGVDNRTGATHWYLGQTRRPQHGARGL